MNISVVICTYNRAKFIKSAIESLAKQDMDKLAYEIIVVNNNSSDQTETYCLEMLTKYKDIVQIRYFVEANQGLSFARNRGISEAKYELITYMDDDGVAEIDFLSKISSFFQGNPQIVGLGGKVIPIYETSEPKWLSYHTRMMVTHIDYGEIAFKCYGKKYPPGCNMTYKKETLLAAGGFNEKLKWRVDDKYIFYEVQKINNQIYYNPLLKVGHHIDKERITDENFNLLSIRLGQEEKLRVKGLGMGQYFLKIFEYMAILMVSFFYYLKFSISGEASKGVYLIRMRFLALKGMLFG